MDIDKIYLGDAYELIKQVPDHSVDLIMTDPPYAIQNLHTGTGILKDKSKARHIEEMKESGLGSSLVLKILDEFMRVMKVPNIYIWCNKKQIYDYMTYFVKEHNCKFDIIIWAKNNPIPFVGGHYLNDKEYCLFFYKGAKVQGDYNSLKTCYITSTNKEDKKQYLHPTIKPEEIIKTLVKNSCCGGIVLDPFVGSGTTCVCAKRLGLHYLGFEINPKYHKIAVDRINGINQKGEMNLLDMNFKQLNLNLGAKENDN
jgi:DNA modification methylase